MAGKRSRPWSRSVDGGNWVPAAWQGWVLLAGLLALLVIGVNLVINWRG